MRDRFHEQLQQLSEALITMGALCEEAISDAAKSYFTRDQLLNTIWGYEFDGASRTVDVHIRTLRQKLGESGGCIETVRGVGYKIAEG